MADGGYFENGFIAISQPGIIRFQCNLVCKLRFWFQEGSRDKLSTFCKIKLVDSRHIEDSFSNISMIYCPINAKYGTKKQNHTQTHDA